MQKAKHWAMLLLTVGAVLFAGLFHVEHVGAATFLPAFPGAMGGGSVTTGGRNGTIIEVTNLNDTGTGSLRACLTASGLRTCECRVGGVIPIRSDVTVQSNMTFDGQSCPGGGLIMGDGNISGRPLNITAHDVVIRYLGLWVNNPNIPVGPDTGTTGIEIGTGAYNVVLDHISCAGAGNKCEISYTSTQTQAAVIHDYVVMNSIVGLPNVGHPVGPMTDTSAFAYLSVNQDFFMNLFPWIGHRIALYNTNKCHWVNNLTFNWSDPSAQYGFAMEPQGPSTCDIIGNIWVKGNLNAGNTANPHPVNINATGSSDCTASCWNGATTPSDYLSGNVCAQGTDWQCAAQITAEGGPEVGPVPAAWQRSTPISPETEPNPIVPLPTAGLDTLILSTVGNSRGVDCTGNWFMRRNSIDQMLVTSYPNGTGALFNQQYPAPTAAAGSPCAEDPTTHVPVAYLAARGLQPGMSPWAVAPGDTYPIIETYNNGPGTPPSTSWTGWLGADALPGAKIGAQVVISASAGPVRNTNAGVANFCTPGGPVGPTQSPQPTPVAGATVTVLAGPSPACSNNVQYWQVQYNGATPPHPTVTCTPSSIPALGTASCTANQTVNWSSSAGSITSAGVFTAPGTAQTVTITGTNANGSGTTPVTVTASTTVYPVINVVIGIPGGPQTALTCTANQTTGAYTCQCQ